MTQDVLCKDPTNDKVEYDAKGKQGKGKEGKVVGPCERAIRVDEPEKHDEDDDVVAAPLGVIDRPKQGHEELRQHWELKPEGDRGGGEGGRDMVCLHKETLEDQEEGHAHKDA